MGASVSMRPVRDQCKRGRRERSFARSPMRKPCQIVTGPCDDRFGFELAGFDIRKQPCQISVERPVLWLEDSIAIPFRLEELYRHHEYVIR